MTTHAVNNSARPMFKLVAVAEDETTGDFFATVAFKNRRGETSRVAIPRAEFSDINAVLARLKTKGAALTIDEALNEGMVRSLIEQESAAPNWIFAGRTGWRANNELFVQPGCVLGKQSPGVRVRPPRGQKATKAGSLSGWKTAIAESAKYSSRAVLGLCAALAAPLLVFSKIGSFGIFINGPSKLGKSTLLLMASTFLTNFGKEEELPDFNTTGAAYPELLERFNDILLTLNEQRTQKGHRVLQQQHLQELAYTLAQGKGTTYAQNYTDKVRSWRTVVLANGEYSLDQLAQKAGELRMAGEAIRFIDVPALQKDHETIFDLMPSNVSKTKRAAWAETMCKKVRAACEKYHGVAGRKFIKEVIKRLHVVEAELAHDSGVFLKKVRRDKDRATTTHLARCFAHIYASGIMGIRLGLLPWSQALVMKCVKRCYFAARANMNSADDLVRQARKSLANKLSGGTIVRRGAAVRNAEGFTEQVGRDTRFTVRRDSFQRWFSDSRQPALVLQWLAEQGALPGGLGKPSSNSTNIKWAASQPTWPDKSRHWSIVFTMSPELMRKLAK